MTIKRFDKLCDDAKKIRTEVFVNEQGFSVEFDDIDDIAVHVVGYDEGVPAAVCSRCCNTSCCSASGSVK